MGGWVSSGRVVPCPADSLVACHRVSAGRDSDDGFDAFQTGSLEIRAVGAPTANLSDSSTTCPGAAATKNPAGDGFVACPANSSVTCPSGPAAKDPGGPLSHLLGEKKKDIHSSRCGDSTSSLHFFVASCAGREDRRLHFFWRGLLSLLWRRAEDGGGPGGGKLGSQVLGT